jgi:hypothetical protein
MAVGMKRPKLVIGDIVSCRSTIIFHQRRVAQLMLGFKKMRLAFMPVVMEGPSMAILMTEEIYKLVGDQPPPLPPSSMRDRINHFPKERSEAVVYKSTTLALMV